MSKKWKDTTKGGFEITELLQLGTGGFIGIVNRCGHSCNLWRSDGKDCDDCYEYDLVPAEPEVIKHYYKVSLDYAPEGVLQRMYANLQLVFNPETGQLVSAEVI